MAERDPRVFTIEPGASFLTALADALTDGRLIPGFPADNGPMALADATIYVPTRRSARRLRAIFTERTTTGTAILPAIRPLGEFDEDAPFFQDGTPALPDLDPPVGAMERLLALAPLVQAWKGNVTAEIGRLLDEEVTLPNSFADALWLARDLTALMDEIETEGAGWDKLGLLADGDLAHWWQVTVKFLEIVTASWPAHLASIRRSNPAAHRNALIEAEAERLRCQAPRGPVIAAGSTGSIPATARLLGVIARLDQGAVILPGLDTGLDEESWSLIGNPQAAPSVFGHPQYALKKLLARLGIDRREVTAIAGAEPLLARRRQIVSQALRPAETTDRWADAAADASQAVSEGAFDGVALLEARHEREEAMAIAVALRKAIEDGHEPAALVTGDRTLARRVSAELTRFGIAADDSAGTPLGATPPATLLTLLVEASLRPGDPLTLLALAKHPLTHLGLDRAQLRETAEFLDLAVLRGGAARPDIATLADLASERLAGLAERHPPHWVERLTETRLAGILDMAARLSAAAAPLLALRGQSTASVSALARASVLALEAVGRDADGGLAALYRGEAGDTLAELLRDLLASGEATALAPGEWPDALLALVAGETVKPRSSGETRVQILGQLEARLQDFGFLVLGGLNEGSWPRRAEADRFMSRLMKSMMALEPPERRIGQAAHDFEMALGARRLLITRSMRQDNAPASRSRWLQRLLTFAGPQAEQGLISRGAAYLDWARMLDRDERVDFAARPAPVPPLAKRPKHFSVTDIETLRRDPYAIFARKILNLRPLEPLVGDPGAAERGTLFHEVLHRFTKAGINPQSPDASDALVAIGRACFAELALPADIEAVWWPRFEAMIPGLLDWEAERQRPGTQPHAEVGARRTVVEPTGVTLSGRADRIDLHADGTADILDYKTGAPPSAKQVRALLAPQLPLEAALAMRGAFDGIAEGTKPGDLAYVRLGARGEVEHKSVLGSGKDAVSSEDLAEQSWEKLTAMLAYYTLAETGYVSRLLPLAEGAADGDYDHLARVLEWSAGNDGKDGGEGE
ncbi:double-strand break repair protein AddB [Zhengella mangrovi]|uniref:Double-strand break repair protein AddB n=1 Tax=Zhengella mangrovi TaxID=1982044 RepID=A0A2G1QTS4_9HYPH|nr:double-strand break repair protein AddB [Zhengella mangrovi]PHP68956.1 double-strand break repair protein AddB [Zhengella mangrovi]